MFRKPPTPLPSASKPVEARTVEMPSGHHGVAAPASNGNPLTKRPKRRRGSRFFYISFLTAVGLTTLMAAAAVGLFMSYIGSLPPITTLENYDPPEISRVFDRTGTIPIGEFKKERRQVVRIAEVPDRLRKAFLAIEDARFYDHYGVDIIGVVRALYVDLRAKKMVQGASGITQQLTRDILGLGRKQTLERKIKEAILTFQIERRYSKDQILEFYLNHTFLGKNSFGVKAAAETYFSRPLDQLSLSECAVLAGIPNAPSRYNPIYSCDLARWRRDLVLGRMREEGWITKKEYETAKAESIVVRQSEQMVSAYPSFLSGLASDLKRYYNLTDEGLQTKGLRITTTLDAPIQEACDMALREGLVEVEKQWQAAKSARRAKEDKDLGGIFGEGTTRLMEITKLTEEAIEVRQGTYHGKIPRPENVEALYHNPKVVLKVGQLLDVRLKSVDQNTGNIEGVVGNSGPVQGAMVVLDAHTAEVLALVGGTVGEWNRATQGGRQAGSSFKPFFYATALERGHGPNSIIVDEPIEFSWGSKNYRPTNYSREGFYGPITLIQALEESRNVATIRLYEALGFKKALAQVERFNAFQLGHGWVIPPEISSCLGTMDCSPMELAAAYQIFANGGIAIRPQFFRNALDSDGRIELPTRRQEEPILKPVTAYQMTYMLRQVVIQAPDGEGRLGGTGYSTIGKVFPSPPNSPICGKTGTTTNNIDAWFCGFTPDLVIISQVGFDDRTPMGPKLTGGRVAGPIWAAAFEAISKIPGRSWSKSFPMPEGLEVANICADTGKRAGNICYEYDHRIYSNVPFPAGKGPKQACDGGTSWPIIEPLGGQYGDLKGHSPHYGIAHAAYALPVVGGGEDDEGDY